MNEKKPDPVEWLYQEERERVRNEPPPSPPQPQTIHYTELPEDTSESPIAREWNFYRREVGRLLAEGHEGKWVLIKGEEILGPWNSRDEAKAVALERFLLQPVLIRQILSREPLLRGPTFFRLCPN